MIDEIDSNLEAVRNLLIDNTFKKVHCYVPEWNSWMVNKNCVWEKDLGDAAITEHALSLLSRKLISTYANSDGFIGATIRLLKKNSTFIRNAKEFDCYPEYLSANNHHDQPYTVNLRTSEEFATDEIIDEVDALDEYLITKETPTDFTSVDQFDDDEYGPPVKWLSFLERIQPDQEVREYLQRMAGYMLTGYTNHRAFFVFYGPGKNGKSVFANTLLGMLGSLAGVSDPYTFVKTKHPVHKTHIAAMEGKRLVVVNEIPSGSQWNEDLVKRLCSTEPIEVNKMRENPYTITPTAKLLFLTNHLPDLLKTSPAIGDRMHLIPFNERIREDEDNPFLEDELKAEYKGILGWCIEGSRRFFEEGLKRPSSGSNVY